VPYWRQAFQPKRQEESMICIGSHPQIRHRAYEIFQERRQTGRKGDALSDWLEAEQEIHTRRILVQVLPLICIPRPPRFR
jgi:hypothetical protein